MRSLQRRAIYYLGFIALLIVFYSTAYHYGIRTFEGESQAYLHSLQFTVETFTATGYGSDSPWASPQMNLLVILMDLTGVALFFLALPVLLFPLFEDVFSPSVPTALDDGFNDHVVICSYSARAETLIAELRSHGVEYVLVEPDRDRAMDLYADGHTVVHVDPASVSGLEGVNLADARALVADVSDRIDASIVLAARETAEDVAVVSVVEEPDQATYHRLAGADVVFSPRRLVGESLAHKVTAGVSTNLGDTIRIGEDFDIAEFPIHHGSRLAGTTLADSGIRERYGVNVVGAWFHGEFETPPPPNATLDSGTILLVTGHEDQLERLKRATLSTVRRFRRGRTVVVGHGDVGQTVTAALSDADLPYTVVDRRDSEGVDVVGEATDPDVLREAGVEEARTVVLALSDDTVTEFTTLVVRDLNDDAEIVARAERAETVKKTYRAGAEYVLALATVTGRSIASEVLEDEEVLSTDTQVETIRTTAPDLVGDTLEGARIRERTDCTVVAVERNGAVITDLGPGFRIRRGDELIIAGTDEGTNRFVELFG
ncbi:potassium channel family protein [Natribaculum luteum]|uniref:Potassium channel family protein n=1 Tax=Natribaculum luteum TaxID=1586232 RepID=A0ABD5NWG7_9EURY|nr:NAD-binding protein [Natribaculum luteum]